MLGYRPNSAFPIAGPEGGAVHPVLNGLAISVAANSVNVLRGRVLALSTNTIAVAAQSILLTRASDKNLVLATLSISAAAQNVTLAKGTLFALSGAVVSADPVDITLTRVRSLILSASDVVIGAQTLTMRNGKVLATVDPSVVVNAQNLAFGRLRIMPLGTVAVAIAYPDVILARYSKLLKVDARNISVNYSEMALYKLEQKSTDVTLIYNKGQGKKRFWAAVRAKEMIDPDW